MPKGEDYSEGNDFIEAPEEKMLITGNQEEYSESGDHLKEKQQPDIEQWIIVEYAYITSHDDTHSDRYQRDIARKHIVTLR